MIGSDELVKLKKVVRVCATFLDSLNDTWVMTLAALITISVNRVIL